jgi:hypothetical protein
MKSRLALVVCFFLIYYCHSEEFPTFGKLQVGNKIYENVRVQSVDPAFISFTHRDGVARVLIEKLSPELKSQFNFEPALAEKFKNERQLKIYTNYQIGVKREISEALKEQLSKEQVGIGGTVLSVVSNKGVLLDLNPFSCEEKFDFEPNNSVVFVVCKTHGMVDEQVVNLKVYPAGTFSYNSASGGLKTVKQFVDSNDESVKQIVDSIE